MAGVGGELVGTGQLPDCSTLKVSWDTEARRGTETWETKLKPHEEQGRHRGPGGLGKV